VINRLERLYSLFGASDLVDSVVSVGGHAYRKDIRQASFRFINTHLKGDPRLIFDSEVDLVTGPREEIHPIPPDQLRVFPLDSDIPPDALNGRIDAEFVPLAKVNLPKEGEFESWKSELLMKLRRMTFHHFPERIPPAQAMETNSAGLIRLRTEAGISINLHSTRTARLPAPRVLLVVTDSDAVSGSAY
jgi:hypothetical protein